MNMRIKWLCVVCLMSIFWNTGVTQKSNFIKANLQTVTWPS